MKRDIFLPSHAVFRVLLAVVCFLLSSCDLDGGGGGNGGGGQGDLTVLVMGDSISATGTYAGVSPWPALLASNRPNLNVVNRAVSGERMEQGADRLGGQLASAQPDVLVLFYGSNNAIQGRVDAVESACRSSIRAAASAGVETIVVCTVPPMYGDFAGFNDEVSRVNAIIQQAARSEGARIAYVSNEFGQFDSGLFPDGLHPNQNGQQIIMVTVRENI